MYKKLSALFAALTIVTVPALASAHVVVKPAQVGVGEYQTFTTNVPNEKDMPTTSIKLLIPGGLNYVQPNVKPGWDVNVVKNGDDVTEIDWTNGSIPADQRDEFNFAAQVPAKPVSLHWKAYQTYADGTVVSWDQNPTGKEDDGSTPYSITKVVNDLTTANTTATSKDNSKSNDTLGVVFGLVAIVISVGGILFSKRN